MSHIIDPIAIRPSTILLENQSTERRDPNADWAAHHLYLGPPISEVDEYNIGEYGIAEYANAGISNSATIIPRWDGDDGAVNTTGALTQWSTYPEWEVHHHFGNNIFINKVGSGQFGTLQGPYMTQYMFDTNVLTVSVAIIEPNPITGLGGGIFFSTTNSYYFLGTDQWGNEGFHDFVTFGSIGSASGDPVFLEWIANAPFFQQSIEGIRIIDGNSIVHVFAQIIQDEWSPGGDKSIGTIDSVSDINRKGWISHAEIEKKGMYLNL